jgi:hypothetical protein
MDWALASIHGRAAGLADEVEKAERGPVVYTESTKRILVFGETTKTPINSGWGSGKILNLSGGTPVARVLCISRSLREKDFQNQRRFLKMGSGGRRLSNFSGEEVRPHNL